MATKPTTVPLSKSLTKTLLRHPVPYNKKGLLGTLRETLTPVAKAHGRQTGPVSFTPTNDAQGLALARALRFYASVWEQEETLLWRTSVGSYHDFGLGNAMLDRAREAREARRHVDVLDPPPKTESASGA
jgi:hypothetical protein